jgi:indole-3-glycerol phosphate synthase
MSVLERIAAYKREEITTAKIRKPLAALMDEVSKASSPRGFRAALQKKRDHGEPGLIAEIKKASPSKGLIRADFDPAKLARSYERGGATCLSVLTDAPSFQGAPEHLVRAREATALPVLRKDFMLDPYQIVESRALGADCILIIMAMIDDKTARTLFDAAKNLGIDALVEVHNEAELNRALKLDAELIGINNRDLKTFETDIATAIRLAPQVPSDVLIVAESGLSSPADLKALAKAGITTYLVGESLMRASDVEQATRALLESAA